MNRSWSSDTEAMNWRQPCAYGFSFPPDNTWDSHQTAEFTHPVWPLSVNSGSNFTLAYMSTVSDFLSDALFVM